VGPIPKEKSAAENCATQPHHAHTDSVQIGTVKDHFPGTSPRRIRTGKRNKSVANSD